MKKLILTSVFLLALPISAQDRTQAVGRVVSVQGRAEIVWPDGQRNQALRSIEVLEKDTLETGPNGVIQVRFSDGAILSLGCNSSLRIDQYKAGGGEFVEMQLLRGRIRTITGTTDPEKYRLNVNTPNANVRITTPKTDFEVVEESQDRMSSGVYTGGIEIHTNLGSLELGVGEDFAFSRLERGEPPIGVATRPSSLQPNTGCI
ncbi:MAG: FecR family protein [Gammaproteobacteria bacterium]|nr:FecR family protein [Gammaproteobacteria bacterium]